VTVSHEAHTSDHLVANLRVDGPGPLVELASGVDALYLSGRARLPTGFLDRLDHDRRVADARHRPVPLVIGEEIAVLADHAWGRYRFCLDTRLGRIGLTESEHLPAVRVQPRAETLHSLGPKATVAAVEALLLPEVPASSWSVSRVDVFCDVQGWAPCANDAKRFVCRADARRTFEDRGQLTGFSFGSRRTRTLYGRVYDKSAEVEHKGTTWWHEIWGDAHRPGEPVWRIEFEVARDALGEFGLASPDEVLDGAGDLWRYLTCEWLTLREPKDGDVNRSRWPFAREWRQVQQASLVSRRVGAERIVAARRTASVARLLPGLTGYLAAFAAAAGTDDVDDTVIAAVPHLRDYEAVSRTPFTARVERKRETKGLG
jgi:hypothetical protein